MKERGYILHIANLLADNSKEKEITRKAKKNYSYGYWYYDFEKELYYFKLSIEYKDWFRNTTYESFEKQITKKLQYKTIEQNLLEYRKINKIEKEFYDGQWKSLQESEQDYLKNRVTNLACDIGANKSIGETRIYDFGRFQIRKHTMNSFVSSVTSFSFYLIKETKEILLDESIPCFNEILKKMKSYLEIKLKEKTKSEKEKKEIANQEMLEEVQKFLLEDLLATTEIKQLKGKKAKEQQC
jgi:hypothetical protein